MCHLSLDAGSQTPKGLSGFPGLEPPALRVYGHSFSLAQIYSKPLESCLLRILGELAETQTLTSPINCLPLQKDLHTCSSCTILSFSP